VTSSAISAEASTTVPPTRGRRRIMRRVSTLLGIGLALGGGAYVVERIASGWSDYGTVIADARWGWVLAGLAVAALGMGTMGLVWRRIIAALGGKAGRREVYAWYQLGNLGKYLPGGLWSLVGRSELAVRGGLDRTVAYNSVALSMGATYLCGIVVSAVLLPFVLLTQADADMPLWVFAGIPVGLAALHPAVLSRVFRLSERVFGKGAPAVVPPWLTSAGLVARHAIPWLLLGMATWLVALTFAPDAPVLTLVFAGILSWVIGFMVVFVPGGIGVREAMFTGIASAALPPHIAATVAIVSRLVFIGADALGALTAVAIGRWRREVSR
jgi:glycosyltransferase 2 family protein